MQPGRYSEVRYSPRLVARLKQYFDEEAANDEDFAIILASQRAFSANYAYWKRKAYLPRDF